MNNLPAKPPHNRKLGLTGVAMTNARNPKRDVAALSAVRDELEQVLIRSGYLENAPFSWVTISIRFGMKTETEPHFQAINKKYGDLPLAIEIETACMLSANETELKDQFKAAALRALIAASHRYNRPSGELVSMFEAMPSTPNPLSQAEVRVIQPLDPLAQHQQYSATQ